MIPSEKYLDQGSWKMGGQSRNSLGISWSHLKAAESRHKTADAVWDFLEYVNNHDYNLVINTGLLPKGGIDPDN
jgi:hypothetical protein